MGREESVSWLVTVCNPADQYLVAKHAVVFRSVMSNCTMYSVR